MTHNSHRLDFEALSPERYASPDDVSKFVNDVLDTFAAQGIEFVEVGCENDEYPIFHQNLDIPPEAKHLFPYEEGYVNAYDLREAGELTVPLVDIFLGSKIDTDEGSAQSIRLVSLYGNGEVEEEYVVCPLSPNPSGNSEGSIVFRPEGNPNIVSAHALQYGEEKSARITGGITYGELQDLYSLLPQSPSS